MAEDREIATQGKVLPARNESPETHFWAKPAVRIGGSGLILGSIAAWLASQFFQLRGFVSILVSRIDLALVVLCVIGWFWIWARNVTKPKVLAPTLGSIVVIALACGADQLTLPHTKASVESANTVPEKNSQGIREDQNASGQTNRKKDRKTIPHGDNHPLAPMGQSKGHWQLSTVKADRISRLLADNPKVIGNIKIVCIGSVTPEIVDQLYGQFHTKGHWNVDILKIGTASGIRDSQEPLYLLSPDVNGEVPRLVIRAIESADISLPVHPNDLPTIGPMSMGMPDATIVITPENLK